MGRAFLSARYNNDGAAAALRSTTPMPAPAPPAVRRWDALVNPFNPDDEVLDGQDMVFEAVVTPAPLVRTGPPRVRRMVLRPTMDVNDILGSDSDSDSSSTTALLAPAEESDVPVDDPIDAPTPAPPVAATAEDPGDAASRQLYVRMLDAIRPVFEANASGSAEASSTDNNPAESSRRVEEHLRYVSSLFNPHTGRFDDNQFAQFVAPLISSELSMLSHAPALSQSV